MAIRYLLLYLLSLIPVVEGRYALGYALAKHLDPFLSLLIVSLGTSTLAISLAMAFPKIDEFMVSREGKLRDLYDKTVRKLRERVRPYVEKYGAIGLTLFVAVPLPVTGVWTGAIAAYFLGFGKRSLLPLLIGGIASNLISFSLLYPGWIVSGTRRLCSGRRSQRKVSR